MTSVVDCDHRVLLLLGLLLLLLLPPRASTAAAAAATAAAATAATAAAARLPTSTVTVDASASRARPFAHYWKRAFGSGHALLTLRADWQAHLVLAVRDLGLAGVRHHGLLDDDMRVVTGPGAYDFARVEASWRFQVAHNVTPIVELSFMPAVLANCTWTAPGGVRTVNPGHAACETGLQYRGVTMPPTAFGDWYALVRALVQHAVDTFGMDEVRRWSFECWNELWGMPFPQDYMRLYNASAAAVKSVGSDLRVGGPATARLGDLSDFITHAQAIGAPFDFVSSHMYPTDPQCPTGENWGPDCLPDNVKAAKKIVEGTGAAFYLTEYNVGCCIGYPQHDVAGAAAFAFRTIGELDGVTDVLSWWTFTDIFEEDTPVDKHTEYMNIYGLMTVSGVPKPGWRAFQMLHEHGGDTRYPLVVKEESTTPLLARWLEGDREKYIEDASSQCTFENKTNMAGFDVGTASGAKSAADCCAACLKASASCSFWTWANATCYLKSSDAGRPTDGTATSGSKEAPPAPGWHGTRISAMATTRPRAAAEAESLVMSIFLSYWSDTGRETDRRVCVNVPSGFGRGDVTEYRIDSNHANAYPVWQKMGSPPKPSSGQIQTLVEASKVVPANVSIVDGSVCLTMPPNSAIVLEF